MEVAIECIEPEELPSFVDLEKPPLAVAINSKVKTAVGDSRLSGKREHGLLDVRRWLNTFHLHQPLTDILPPINGPLRVMKGKGIHGCAQQYHPHVELLHYHLLINSGGVGEHFVGRQRLLAYFKRLRHRHRTTTLLLPDVGKKGLANHATGILL